MKWMLGAGAALCLVACGSDVTTTEGPPQPGLREDGTVDPELCANGAYDAEGNLIVTGDPCYDQLANSLGGLLGGFDQAFSAFRDDCAALALARGETDTWSSQPTLAGQAQEACAVVAAAAPLADVTCEVDDSAGCETVTTCTSMADPPPIDLDAYAAALDELQATCCNGGDLVDPGGFTPPPLCIPAPGTEACFIDLFAVDSVDGAEVFNDVFSDACGTPGGF